MKKFLFICLALVCLSGNAFSQAKKPIIMVVPSDLWCNQNGYMQEIDENGDISRFPDYKKALQENADLLLVISKINELMAERGFPLKNLESALKSLEITEAETSLYTSHNGSMIKESPIDRLKRSAKADIWMQLTWTINTVGPKRSITYNLQGLDAYTGLQIAGASGTGAPSFSAELPVLLEEAVLQHMDNFNYQLQNYFNGLFENGREVSIMIRAWDSLEYGLESEFDGMELTEIIENWISDNTVGGRYNLTDATENFMSFEQVMIPLFNEKERAIDARAWLRGLQKHLRDQYGVDSKLATRGLGFAQLIVGEK